MRFTTLEQLDSYIERLEQLYMSKHGQSFNNPHTERLRDYLIAIRLELIASEFEHCTDPTSIDTYASVTAHDVQSKAKQYRSRADTHRARADTHAMPPSEAR